MTLTLVSAADSGYFEFINELVDSVRMHAEGFGISINILDVGLTAEQRSDLAAKVQSIVDPDWRVSPPVGSEVQDWYKAMVSRPFLPEIFPGYSHYLWLDADCWIQDGSVISLFLREAERGKLAIVPEVDRTFSHNAFELMRFRQNQAEQYFSEIYGPKTAGVFKFLPVLNVGAFCLAQDAPHWDHWAKAFAEVLSKGAHFFADQASLNHTVRRNDLPFAGLPLYCNWNCNHELLAFDRDGGEFVEPDEPHTTIGIMHLTGKSKTLVSKIRCVDGGSIETGFRLSDFGRLRRD